MSGTATSSTPSTSTNAKTSAGDSTSLWGRFLEIIDRIGALHSIEDRYRLKLGLYETRIKACVIFETVLIRVRRSELETPSKGGLGRSQSG